MGGMHNVEKACSFGPKGLKVINYIADSWFVYNIECSSPYIATRTPPTKAAAPMIGAAVLIGAAPVEVMVARTLDAALSMALISFATAVCIAPGTDLVYHAWLVIWS